MGALAMACGDAEEPGGLSQSSTGGTTEGTTEGGTEGGTTEGTTTEGTTTEGTTTGATTGTATGATTAGEAECGNGSCEPGENTESCPLDCGGPGPGGGTTGGETGGTGGGTAECLQENCPDQFAACGSNPACVAMRECTQGCDNEACVNACADTAGAEAAQQFFAVVECGQTNDCFGGTGGGTTGNPGGGTGVDPIECLGAECPDQLAACLDHNGCKNLTTCLGGCEDNDSDGCQDECLANAGNQALNLFEPLFQCGSANGCVGGGGGGEGSCEGQCGQYEEGAECQCDDECAQFGDCCGDYYDVCDGGGGDVYGCLTNNCQVGNCANNPGCNAALECIAGCNDDACFDACLENAPGGPAQNALTNAIECGLDNGCFEGGGGPECGNGVCEGGETNGNCPEDCDGGGGPYDECLQDNCGDLFAECSASDGCSELATCLEECGDNQACFTQCFFQYPPGVSNLMQELLACGEDAGCFDGGGGPECGNGECEQGENPFNCNEDCGGGGPDCGNNQCEQGENADNCPEDCDNGGGQNSCQDKCGSAFQEGAPCQCDSQCQQFNDCCDDYQDLCGGGNTGNETAQCLLDGCEFGNCLNFNGCNNAFNCMTECTGDDAEECVEDCIDDGPNGAETTLTAAAKCGFELGCWEGGGGGPSCGDGTCDEGEDCAADCLPTDQCIFQSCQSTIFEACKTAACIGALGCFAECAGEYQCSESCMVSADGQVIAGAVAVFECATDAQCIK